MEIREAIKLLLTGKNFSKVQMSNLMRLIMQGKVSPAQLGAFLVGLRIKGETVEEITAAVSVMRDLAKKVRVKKNNNLIDTCGTGGDAIGTFNISTVSAFVAAAAGAQVAKHGNRSISSKSGSADVLELAGIKLNLTPNQVARCINEVGIGFMFAPSFHSAMKHTIIPRQEIGIRTIFNILGPLTNPATAPNQVLGVFVNKLLEPLAAVLQNLGSRHVMVVHADDGLDEITVSSKTEIAELKDGIIQRYSIDPKYFDIPRASLDLLRVNSIKESLSVIYSILNNQQGPARDIVLLNAGAAIYTAGITSTFKDGIIRADKVISNGQARNKFNHLIALTQSFK